MNNDNALTVTPAVPTNEEVVIEPNTVFTLAPTDDVSEQENNPPPPHPSQQSSSLLDELKYLLRPTNSLACTVAPVQASVRCVNLISYIDNQLFFY